MCPGFWVHIRCGLCYLSKYSFEKLSGDDNDWKKSVNEANAFCNFTKSVELGGNGSSYGKLGLAMCYGGGMGVDRDPDHALELVKESAVTNGYAQWILCMYYAERAKSYEGPSELGENLGCKRKAFDYLKSASDNRIGYAMALLGGTYMEGVEGIVSKDPLRGVELIRGSAERGSERGQCLLGMCYYDGVPFVLKKDHEEAKKWFKKAADQGSMRAEDYLKLLSIEDEVAPAVQEAAATEAAPAETTPYEENKAAAPAEAAATEAAPAEMDPYERW